MRIVHLLEFYFMQSFLVVSLSSLFSNCCWVFFKPFREHFLKHGDDRTSLTTLSCLITLIEKMEKNEVKSEYLFKYCDGKALEIIIFMFVFRHVDMRCELILHYCLLDLQQLGTGF